MPKSILNESPLTWTLLADLPDEERKQILAYRELLVEYNAKVNLVSRASIDEIVVRHLDHCLAFNARKFPPNTQIVDWGTGGGLPGIILALLNPDSEFHLVDSRNRKAEAVAHFAHELGLENVHSYPIRAEKWEGSVHYAVSRATAPLLDLWKWSAKVLKPSKELDPKYWPSGLICLKGGDLKEELKRQNRKYPHTKVQRIALDKMVHGGAYATKDLIIVTSLVSS